MKNLKRKLLSVVAIAALSPLSQAGVISYSDTHDLSTTDWFDTLSVSQFNNNLGVLNSINIGFSASMLSNIILDNDNLTGTTVQGTIFIQTIGSFLGLGDLNINLSANTGFQSLGVDDSGDTDKAGDGGFDEYKSLDLFNMDMISVTLDSSNSDFNSFIGNGFISTESLGTLGGYSVLGGGGNIDVNINTEASSELFITYNYTDLPKSNVTSVTEPGSIAILGLGLIGLAGLSLKRRNN